LQQDLANALQKGIDQLHLEVTAEQVEQLLAYLDLLSKWNKAYNLTSVRDPVQMVIRHLLDSLVIAPFLEGERFIDVGTGGGLPGVPMAILFPERQFHLLDSNGKKTRFLFQVKTALSLDNMNIHHSRVESFQAEQLFDVVLSRAFASLDDMVTGCIHLLASNGHFLAMKGERPDEELAAVADRCQLVDIHPLVVPGLAEQRHLVDMTLR
jgi:16S rRNA (guanine527-N7)-methyltransferase